MKSIAAFSQPACPTFLGVELNHRYVVTVASTICISGERVVNLYSVQMWHQARVRFRPNFSGKFAQALRSLMEISDIGVSLDAFVGKMEMLLPSPVRNVP